MISVDTTEAYIYLKDPLQHNRHHCQNRIADCTNQCYSVYDSCNVSACGLTGSDTGDETTVLLHVHRNFVWIDYDGCVEICEEENQDNINNRTNRVCHIQNICHLCECCALIGDKHSNLLRELQQRDCQR